MKPDDILSLAALLNRLREDTILPEVKEQEERQRVAYQDEKVRRMIDRKKKRFKKWVDKIEQKNERCCEWGSSSYCDGSC